MCKILKVSKSGYYRWSRRPVSERSKQVQLLKEKISTVYQQSSKRYGSPRVTRVLRNEGIAVSGKTVAKYMRQMGLQSITRRKYRVQTTDSNHSYYMWEYPLPRF